MNQQWTFETPAQAEKAMLENVLLNGSAPDIDRLNGFTYCGWNHEPIGKLTGEKFKKGFFKTNNETDGYNEKVVQDDQKFRGQWKSASAHKMGFFRISYLKDDPMNKLYKAYSRLVLFNYKVPLNKWHFSFFKVIRDVMVLPNENDHNLLLGKAYL